MIDRKNPSGGVAMYCDDCEKKFDTHHKAFAPVVDHALAEGWKIVPTLSSYSHRCPECDAKQTTLGGPHRGVGE